jgi:hypothetical protein
MESDVSGASFERAWYRRKTTEAQHIIRKSLLPRRKIMISTVKMVFFTSLFLTNPLPLNISSSIVIESGVIQ